jgi:hypothetical protein
MRKNDIYGLPTKLKQCDACIPGKHNKHTFHDYTSRACRNIEMIHYDLYGPIDVPFANGNKYMS